MLVLSEANVTFVKDRKKDENFVPTTTNSTTIDEDDDDMKDKMTLGHSNNSTREK
jgi:hypothetical protein